MAYYEVDLAALAQVIGIMDESVKAFESGLDALGTTIDGLNASWQGIDYSTFQKSYNEGSESTKNIGKKMAQDILEYRAYFNKMLKKYLEVQEQAQKLAGKITNY